MAFFDNIQSKSKEVAQKAKDMAEQTKLKSAIANENNKIKQLYETLGKLYYDRNKDMVSEPYIEVTKSIDQAFAQIAQYEQSILALKEKHNCPNCGHSISSGAIFCNSCGTKLNATTQQAPAGPQKFCSSCGVANAEDAMFCFNCGSKIDVVVEPVTESTVDYSYESAVAEETTNAPVCPNCNSTVDADALFCNECGSKLS